MSLQFNLVIMVMAKAANSIGFVLWDSLHWIHLYPRLSVGQMTRLFVTKLKIKSNVFFDDQKQKFYKYIFM